MLSITTLALHNKKEDLRYSVHPHFNSTKQVTAIQAIAQERQSRACSTCTACSGRSRACTSCIRPYNGARIRPQSWGSEEEPGSGTWLWEIVPCTILNKLTLVSSHRIDHMEHRTSSLALAKIRRYTPYVAGSGKKSVVNLNFSPIIKM